MIVQERQSKEFGGSWRAVH